MVIENNTEEREKQAEQPTRPDKPNAYRVEDDKNLEDFAIFKSLIGI